MAVELYPIVRQARELAFMKQVRVLRKHMADEYGLDVEPAEIRFYGVDAVESAVRFAAGLDERVAMDESGMDDDSRRRAFYRRARGRGSASWAEFQDRLELSLCRHVQQAAREAVLDTADKNVVSLADERLRREFEDSIDPLESEDFWREFESGPTIEDYGREREAREAREAREVERDRVKRERSSRRRPRGVVLGWARVLAGETNCAFCAMLASRGPVYHSEGTASFDAHDGCDCGATLVVKGERWEGEDEFKALRALWEDARDNPNDWELSRMEFGQLNSPAKRFRSRFRVVDLKQVGEFKPSSVRRAESFLRDRGVS